MWSETSLARICNACVALAKIVILLLLLRNTPTVTEPVEVLHIGASRKRASPFPGKPFSIILLQFNLGL